MYLQQYVFLFYIYIHSPVQVNIYTCFTKKAPFHIHNAFVLFLCLQIPAHGTNNTAINAFSCL